MLLSFVLLRAVSVIGQLVRSEELGVRSLWRALPAPDIGPLS